MHPHDEKIPACVEDDEALPKGDPVVQKAVHHMIGLSRVPVLHQKIAKQVGRPEQQPPQVAELRLVDSAQAEASQIRLRRRKVHGSVLLCG